MSFIPSFFRVLTGAIVVFGASLFLNIGGDTGSFEALLAMGAQAKEKCITVDGKRVCLVEEGAKKKNDDDDDDKPKKKKGGDDTRLTDCTIQQSGGGGCKGGFKRVCEKMKGGKKCCGCVPDPNAKTQTTPVQAQPTTPVQAQTVCCFASVDGVSASGHCSPTEAQARELASGVKIKGKSPTSIKCAPKK